MKKRYIFLPLLFSSAILVTGLSLILISMSDEEQIYKSACRLLNDYDYLNAHDQFKKVRGYKDSDIKDAIATSLNYLTEDKDYERAIDTIVKSNGCVNVDFLSSGSKNNSKIIKSRYIDETSYKEHYSFSGWKLNTFYYVEDSTTVNISLIADFKEDTYSIDYDVLPGFIIDAKTKYTYNQEDIIIPSPTREGYSFIGWKVNDEENIYQNYTIKKGSSGNFFFKAVYEAKTYTINLNPNGGDCSISSLDVKYDEMLSLPECKKENYTFLGWYLDDTKIEGKYTIDKNVTLTAKFTPSTYRINYNLEGGYFLSSYPEYYSYSTERVKIPYPSRKDSVFCGWIIDDDNVVLDYEILPLSTGEINLRALFINGEFSKNNTRIEKLTSFTSYRQDGTRYPAHVLIPYYVTEISEDCFSTMDEILSFSLELNNDNFHIENDFLLTKDKKKALFFARSRKYSSADTVISVPDSVTSIGKNCFSNNSQATDKLSYRIRGKVEGKNVTEIYDNAFFYSYISSVDFPKCKYIGNYAFYYCTQLLDFNDTFKNIYYLGDYSFAGNRAEEITLYENLANLGYRVFESSRMKRFFCLSDIIDDFSSVLQGCVSLQEIYLKSATTRILSMFSSYIPSSLVKIEVGSGSAIPDEFLKDIRSINTVSLPRDITSIGKYAFKNNSISSIVLDDVVTIDEYAFSGCKNLTSVDLSNNTTLKTIKKYAFEDTGLSEITIPESVETIEDYAFYNTKLKQITLPVSSFKNFSKLFNTDIPFDSLKINLTGEGKISYDMFSSCYGIEEINVSENITFDDRAFKDLTTLKKISLPSSVKKITNSMFYNCTSLENIYLPEIEEIGTYSFYNCYNLQYIKSSLGYNHLPSTLKKIGSNSLGSLTKIHELYIPEGIENISKEAFVNCNYDLYFKSGTDTSKFDPDWNYNFFGHVNSY